MQKDGTKSEEKVIEKKIMGWDYFICEEKEEQNN